MGKDTKVKKDASFYISDVDCIAGGDKDLPQSYHEYRKKWEKVNGEHLATDFPMHIDVELNMTCNYTCLMCPRTALNIKNENQNMDDGLYRKIIDEGKREGLLSVDFCMLGETLLRSNILDLIKYATDAGLQDRIVHTNAALLDENMSKGLLDAGITKLSVSLDGFSKETYETIRRGGNYDTVKKNVLKFIELKNERGLSYPVVRLSFIRMSINEHEIPAFVDFWKDKVNYISIQEYINPSGKQDGTLKAGTNAFKREKPKEFICNQLFQRLSIRWDGTIMPCCVDMENRLALGNANTMTLKQAWHSPKMEKLRELHLAGKYMTIPTCESCMESRM